MHTNRDWKPIKTYREILLDEWQGIARITINRPHVRNAFTPLTTWEMSDALRICNESPRLRVVLLTGADSPRKEGQSDEEWMATNAFCAGGDMNVKGRGGYIGEDGLPHLSVLDVQRQIRSIPKPVIAMVNGYAVGGGHILHLLCDLTIAAETAKFGQTGPKVGSFDAGYGAGYLASIVGQKKAREIWYLCRLYTAAEAEEMGMVNKVVPFDELEDETIAWCKRILMMSPTALRFMKASFNAATDGFAGLQQLGGDATMLYYTTEEAMEGRDAFKEKRDPDFSQWPRLP